ncbi:hypothetical protein ACAW74_25790 [Fibrella sp. WM1]|uniref:hypothetical protein n=1 Tax=Fibrella musci TaxID=3242485 RepID=UPI003520988F
MTPQQLRLHQRNEAIRSKYFSRHDKGFRNEIIVADLAMEFFLSLDTVQKIVWQRGHYRQRESTVATQQTLQA